MLLRTLLTLSIAFTIVGCGKSESPKSQASVEASPTEPGSGDTKAKTEPTAQKDESTATGNPLPESPTVAADNELPAEAGSEAVPVVESLQAEVLANQLEIATTPVLTAVRESAPLEQQVHAIFKHRCAMCHDDLGAGAGGDVDYLLDLAKVADPDGYLVDHDDPSDSHLRTIIEDSEMPKPRMKDIEWNGPLTDQEKATVFRWLDKGAPVTAKEAPQRDWLRAEEVRSLIARDLESIRQHDARETRFISLVNLWNDSTVSDEELELYRAAVVKLLNSLSRSADVLGLDTSDARNRVKAVDRNRTVLRFRLSDIGWTTDDWEKLARCYPLARQSKSGTDRIVHSLAGCSQAVIRADWFAFTASQPPLYHELLGIPQNLEMLERELGVDRLANIRAGRIDRAGFGKSKVSVNNRLIERHAMPRSGAYWISYDFRKNDGGQNLFRNPLGPPGAFESDDVAFEHDGGEVIYTLPNGFQAYVLVTADGSRLDIAPTSIVHDDSMPGGVIINGVSCMSCHYSGMKPENPAELAKLDRVRSAVSENYRDFSQDQRELVLQLYPKHSRMTRLIKGDSAVFQRAMEEAGLPTSGTTEPVRALFDRFARDVTPEAAAAGLGLTSTEFETRMQRETETRQMLVRLRDEGVRRQLYLQSYGRLVRLTGQGEPMASAALRIPYFGNAEIGGDTAGTSHADRQTMSSGKRATITRGGLALPGPDKVNAELVAMLVRKEAEFKAAKKPKTNEEKYQQAVRALILAEAAALVSDTKMDENLTTMIFRLMALRAHEADLNNAEHLDFLATRLTMAAAELFKLVEADMLNKNGPAFRTLYSLYQSEIRELLQIMRQRAASARYARDTKRADAIRKAEQKLGSFLVTQQQMHSQLGTHPEQSRLWKLALKMELASNNLVPDLIEVALVVHAAEEFNKANDWSSIQTAEDDQRLMMLHTTVGPAIIKQMETALELPNPEPFTRLRTVMMNILKGAPKKVASGLRDQFNKQFAQRVHGSDFVSNLGPDAIKLHREAARNSQVVLYEFAAAWCKPCRENIPELAKLQSRFESNQVSLVLVELDPKESAKNTIVNDLRMSGVRHSRLDRYVTWDDVPGHQVPLTVVCDAEGRVLMSHTGSLSIEDVGQFGDWLDTVLK